MTVQQILALFRIGNRFVPRTGTELAGLLGIDPKRIGNTIRPARDAGYITGYVAGDQGGKYTEFNLTEMGRAFLSQQPVKRGRVLTAVPKGE